MKNIFFSHIAFIILTVSFCKASDIDTTKALQIAQNFYTERIIGYHGTGISNISLELVNTEMINGEPVYYIFGNNGNSGFVIISATDAVYPVLAYSFESDCDPANIPPAYTAWMKNYCDQILYVKKNNYSPSPEIQEAWEKYSKGSAPSDDIDIKAVGPLLTTNWNQGSGYNSYCPEDPAGPGGHVYTGCVATAMAQVMKYHSFPETGTGSKCYNHGTYGELCADFGATTYNWASMPSGSSDEVAKLMYHCGVSVSMDYGPTGSGASTSGTANSLIEYFKYSPNLLYTYKSKYTEENWRDLLCSELDNSRVLSYKGSNHAFVCDGYQGTDHFHFNWGWGGSYNGYFYLNDLSPGSYDFTNSQACLVGVEPETDYAGMDCTGAVNLTCDVPYNGTTTDGINNVNRYGCYSIEQTGKEKIHIITTTEPGRIKAKVSNTGDADLDVIILNYCCRDSCVAGGDSVAITIGDVPAGIYYIVVDGRYGYQGDYTITVTCPNDKPDLIVQVPYVAPYYVEHGMENVLLSCYIKNLGKTQAGTSEMKFYYSDDEFYDASDLLFDSTDVPVIDAGDSVKVIARVTMPASGMSSGFGKRIIFEADADNDIDEFDEDLNYNNEYISIFDPGSIDCSSAVELTSGIEYNGNTSVEGNSFIDVYSGAGGASLPGKEVLHKITSPYDGKMQLFFNTPDGSGGDGKDDMLKCVFLNGCNENSMINIYYSDSVFINELFVIKGHTYLFSVDATSETYESEYDLLVTLPDSCPGDLSMWISGDTTLCEGDDVYMNTDWSYNSYQWYKDGIPIPGAVDGQYSANETGVYTVGVTENSCETLSREVYVAVSPVPPEGAVISASGSTEFCEGDNVELVLTSGTSYEYQWLLNGDTIPGETGMTYFAGETGVYEVLVKNDACTFSSDEISVKVLPLPADTGDTLQPSFADLETYYPFTYTTYGMVDASGNGNDCGASGAIKCDDRFGNPEQAYEFDGVNDYVYTTYYYENINILSLVIWFRTTTSAGGKLAGFSTSRFYDNSFKEDRHIYMSNSGKIYFGVNDGSKEVVSSPGTYNDNNWHLATATLSGTGMKLYIDTILVDSRPTPVTGDDYKGYIKIGKGYVDGWPGEPSGTNFQGQLDDFMFYEREISLSEIKVIYDNSKVLSYTASPGSACDSGVVTVTIFNSEPNIDYILRYDSDDTPASVMVEGNGGSIVLTGDIIYSTSTFNVFAVNSLTSCENEFSEKIILNIYDTPEIPEIIQTAPDSLASSVTAYGYQWFLDGNLLPDTTQVIYVDQEGFYTVIAYNNECFSDTSDSYLYIPTGVAELDDHFLIYPNPCNTGTFYIRSGQQTGSKMKVSIYSLSGKKLFEQYYENQDIIHCSPNIQNGSYLVVITTEEDEKFIKLLSIINK